MSAHFIFFIALFPVLIYLGLLLFMDSYKLVRTAQVLSVVGSGILAAMLSWGINTLLIDTISIQFSSYSRWIAPWVEESVKALFILILLKKSRLAFLVDSLIYGFAVGTGFALVENIYYYLHLHSVNPAIWIIRGIGTAVMHGGCTAIFALITKRLYDGSWLRAWRWAVPGLAMAGLLHAMFNMVYLHPIVTSIIQVILFPVIVIPIYHQSERNLKNWLEIGMDTDMELLESIKSGQILQTRIGLFLQSLKDRFTPIVLGDMLCYLQIHLELAVRAKGILLLREVNMNLPDDPDIQAKFTELEYLKKNIGPTGRHIVDTFIHYNTRDLWHIYFLTPTQPPKK